MGEGDEAEARIRQIDDLKYALRSVNMFAPWVRRIFIATDSVPPAWLAEHPNITIVRAEEHFSDPAALPTYSFACGGKPTAPFFSPGGVTRFIEAKTRVGLGANDSTRSGFENAARVNRQLIFERFGQVITRHLEHTALGEGHG